MGSSDRLSNAPSADTLPWLKTANTTLRCEEPTGDRGVERTPVRKLKDVLLELADANPEVQARVEARAKRQEIIDFLIRTAEVLTTTREQELEKVNAQAIYMILNRFGVKTIDIYEEEAKADTEKRDLENFKLNEFMSIMERDRALEQLEMDSRPERVDAPANEDPPRLRLRLP